MSLPSSEALGSPDRVAEHEGLVQGSPWLDLDLREAGQRRALRSRFSVPRTCPAQSCGRPHNCPLLPSPRSQGQQPSAGAGLPGLVPDGAPGS